jgi:serine/threonine protein phosphatase PrpC
MQERKPGPEEAPSNPIEELASEEREVSDSERPTNRPTKKETEPGVLEVFSASYQKNIKGSKNEDAYLSLLDKDREGGLFAVSDGMGGRPGGEIASDTVVDTLGKYQPRFEAILSARRTGDKTAGLEAEANLLRKALREANARVVLKRGQYPDQFREMAATCTAVRLTQDAEGKPYAIIGHAGDSRAYVLYPDGRLETETLDAHLSLMITKHHLGEANTIEIQNVLDNLANEEEFETYANLLKKNEDFPEDAPVTVDDISLLNSGMKEKQRTRYFRLRSELAESFGNLPNVTTKVVALDPGSRVIVVTDAIDGLRRTEFEAIVKRDFEAIDDQGLRFAAEIWEDDPAASLANALHERNDPHSTHPKAKPDDATIVIVTVPER